MPLEIQLHRPFSLLRMASDQGQDTILDVVKATSSEGTVPEAGSSGSSATKEDSGKLARVAGRSKSMSIGGSEVTGPAVGIQVPRPLSLVSKVQQVAGA